MVRPGKKGAKLATAAAVVFLCACGDDAGAGLDQLIADYEEGLLTRDQFREALETVEAPEAPETLPATVTVSTIMRSRDRPYRVSRDVRVSPGSALVAVSGVELLFADGANLNVDGRLYAIGAEGATVVFRAAEGGSYGSVVLRGGPNQILFAEMERAERNLVDAHPDDTHTLVEDTRFDFWSDVAIDQVDSSGLTIVRSRFGFDTPGDESGSETIRARNSGYVRIEGSEFSPRTGYRDAIDLQDCRENSWPIVIGNRFFGGEDDAVDLDTCSALVVGNLITDFTPADFSIADRGVNGGGVTGDKQSFPIIVNNVIDGCYHAIGFKNGAGPVIVNNTITNSNIGITLYQSAVGEPQPAGVAVNNILWNNIAWQGGEPQDIVLNGKWWPQYNQVDEVQASIDARYNITASGAGAYIGDGNIADDPLLEFTDRIPTPAVGSPAIDSGLGDLSFEGVPMEQVLEQLGLDYLGNPRRASGGALIDVDRGAIERPQ